MEAGILPEPRWPGEEDTHLWVTGAGHNFRNHLGQTFSNFGRVVLGGREDADDL